MSLALGSLAADRAYAQPCLLEGISPPWSSSAHSPLAALEDNATPPKLPASLCRRPRAVGPQPRGDSHEVSRHHRWLASCTLRVSRPIDILLNHISQSMDHLHGCELERSEPRRVCRSTKSSHRKTREGLPRLFLRSNIAITQILCPTS